MNRQHTTLSALLVLLSACAVEMGSGVSLDIFDKSPDTVDVSGAGGAGGGQGDKIVVCDMTITSTGFAVMDARCGFKSSGGQIADCLATSHVANKWSCPVTILENAESGTWTVDYISVRDTDDPPSVLRATGAELVADAANVLEGDATRVDLAVTSTTADLTPPTILSFEGVSTTVYPGSPVTCRVLTDEDPVMNIGCTFVPDDASASISCVSTDSDTCYAVTPAGVDVGVVYTEINHFARDKSLNLSIGDDGKTLTVVAPASTGTIAVDMALLPGECAGAGWSISPGGLAGAGDLAATDIAPGDYTITWNPTLACSNPAPELKAVVLSQATTFDLAPGNYSLLSTFSGVNTDVGVDGNYGSAPPGGGPWTMESDDMPTEFAASGTGDVTGVVPSQGDFYVGRDYTITWGPEDDHTAPSPEAITTSGTYQGNYIDLSPGGCDSKVADLSVSGNAWVSSTVQTEANAILTFEAYVRAASVETVVSISAVTPIVDFSDNAMLVRWNGSGNFDVYNETESAYEALVTRPATLNVWHKITITADVQAGTYSVDIGTCDEAQQTIATDYTFRSGASSSGSQYYYNLWSYTGTTEIEGASWTPEACTPDTCISAGYECGTPDDGCGTPLASCGTCGGTEVCFPEGTCCEPGTVASICTANGYECDSWDDGCGSTVDCNTGGETCDERVPGDYCLGGTCTTPGPAGAPYAHVTPADVGVTVGVGVVAPVPTVVYTGPQTITTPGTVIENVIIQSFSESPCLEIAADNVTVRNVIMVDCDGFHGISIGHHPNIQQYVNNVTVEYSKFIMVGGGKNVRIVYTNGAIFRNNEVVGGQDFFWIGDGDDLLIENNYIHTATGDAASHADGFQWPAFTGPGVIHIRGNWIDKDDPDTAPNDTVFHTGSQTVYFENNFMTPWGGYTLRCDGDPGASCIIRDNVYAQEFKDVWFPGHSGRRAVQFNSTVAGPSIYRCNRYEDATFIPDSLISGNKTHDITGCPSYP